LMSVTVCSEASRLLPLLLWHILVTTGLATTMAVIVVHRHFRAVPNHQLLHPRHIREIAEALELAVPRFVAASEHLPGIRVGYTSLGIQISGCENRGQGLCHYTISSRDKPLSYGVARVLSTFICTLRSHARAFDLIQGRQDIFHCVVRSQVPNDERR